MPKAGYCSECKKNVWLKEDGSCQFGHPASSISYTYETESQRTSQSKPFGQWFKRQTLLVKVAIIGGIAFLFLAFFALASVSDQEKKEVPQVKPESTYEEPTKPSDTTPPSLTITQPTDNSTTDNAQITVSGKTEPGARLEVNGNQQKVLEDGSFSFPFTLSTGENRLLFKATDAAANTTPTLIKVTYNPPPTFQPPPPKEPPPSPPPGGQFVGNRRSRLLHNLAHGSCQNYVNMMSESNKVFFSSVQEGINAGYQPCKKCY